MNVLFIALGGAIGAVSRYGLFHLLRNFEHIHIRIGVFAANVIGSFLIGIALGLFLKFGLFPRGSAGHFFFVTGFLGAFTTFSTFAQDNLEFLILEKNMTGFILNTGANFLATMVAVALGYFLIVKLG